MYFFSIIVNGFSSTLTTIPMTCPSWCVYMQKKKIICIRDAHLVLAFFTMRREEEEVRVSEWRCEGI